MVLKTLRKPSMKDRSLKIFTSFMVGKVKTLNEHLNLWGLVQKTESLVHFYCLI